MNLSDYQIEAVREFILSVTLPLCLVGDDGDPKLNATGNIFRISGRTFLVTARHAFDGIDPKLLHFPHRPREGRFHGFEDIIVVKPTDKHVDVAVIEFTSPAVLTILEENWGALTLDNVASRPEGALPTFVAGYPFSLTKANLSHLKGQIIYADTVLMQSPPSLWDDDYEPDLDLFFTYSPTSSVISGNTISTPKLPGVSGGAIWRHKESNAPIWTAASSLEVLGVQSTYVENKYIRAKNWWAVASVLAKIDDSLATLLRQRARKADLDAT